jgi:hypothetical protein
MLLCSHHVATGTWFGLLLCGNYSAVAHEWQPRLAHTSDLVVPLVDRVCVRGAAGGST